MELPVGQIAPDALLAVATTRFEALSNNLKETADPIAQLKAQHDASHDVALQKPWRSLNCGDRWCGLSGPSKSVLKSGSDICNHSRPETSQTSATCVANARVQGTEGSNRQ